MNNSTVYGIFSVALVHLIFHFLRHMTHSLSYKTCAHMFFPVLGFWSLWKCHIWYQSSTTAHSVSSHVVHTISQRCVCVAGRVFIEISLRSTNMEAKQCTAVEGGVEKIISATWKNKYISLSAHYGIFSPLYFAIRVYPYRNWRCYAIFKASRWDSFDKNNNLNRGISHLTSWIVGL